MQKTLNDSELDALLDMPALPIMDDGFSLNLHARMKKHERLHLYLPFIFGIVGAIISSYFLPMESFQALSTAFSHKENLISLTSSPITFAIILSCPLAYLLVKTD